jgi:hypothetical protein
MPFKTNASALMSLPSTPETMAGRKPSVAQRPYGADIDLDAEDGAFGFERNDQSPASPEAFANNPFASPSAAGLARQGSVAPQLRAAQVQFFL